MVLLWELPAAGKPVKEALSPARAMDHLDHLLIYHGLDYVDAFVMEIPCITGGEVRGAVAVLVLVSILLATYLYIALVFYRVLACWYIPCVGERVRGDTGREW